VNRVGVRSLLEAGSGSASASGSRSGSGVSLKKYSRKSDHFQNGVMSFGSLVGEEIDEILNDRSRTEHQCPSPLIGFLFPTDSTSFKTATFCDGCDSLEDVLRNSLIARIALAMKSAHKFRIGHGLY
jgi:hypothetical protein